MRFEGTRCKQKPSFIFTNTMARPRGRPKSIVSIMAPRGSNVNFTEGNKSKGILDDFAVRKNIDTAEGTIQKVPINDKDITNKAYVDSVAGDGGLWEIDGAETQLITPDAIDMQSKDIINTNILQFDKITDPAFSEGQLWYSSDTSSLSFHDAEADVTLQIGQELWIPVRNTTGTTIPDFSPVYQTGAVGHRATIALGKADNITTAKLIGITTHSIENNTNGFVTVEGSINNVDTDGSPQGETWNNGDTIYLSTTTAGEKTNIRPSGADDFVIELGKVLDATNNGSFLTKGLQTTNILDEDTMTTNSSTQAASQQSVKVYVDTSVANIVDSAPETLDTLNELAAALGDDPNFATTVSTSIGLNTTHRGTDGTADHSQVATNKTHVDGNGSDHTDVAANTAARVGADNGLYKQSSSTFTDNDTAQTFTDAFVTTSSLVIVSITGAVAAGIWSVVSEAGSFTITSTAAESTDITFDYFVMKN